MKGFAVHVTNTGTKSFIVETKVNSKTRRKALGKYPNLTVEQARKLAKERLGEIPNGHDPEAEAAEKRARVVTLAEAFDTYLQTRKALKPKTIKDYRRVMAAPFKDWQRRALVDTTKDMVERRHHKIAQDRGEAMANLSMRVLRAACCVRCSTSRRHGTRQMRKATAASRYIVANVERLRKPMQQITDFLLTAAGEK